MKHSKSIKKLHTASNGWEALLSEAEAQLAKAQAKVIELRKAVEVFKDNVERGVPFPDEDCSLVGSGG